MMDYGKIIETLSEMQKGYPRPVDYKKLRYLVKHAMDTGERHAWQMLIEGDKITLLALVDESVPDEGITASKSGIYLTYHAIDRAIERHYRRYIRESGRRIPFCDWLAGRAAHAYDNGETGLNGRYYYCGISFAIEQTKERGLVLKTVV